MISTEVSDASPPSGCMVERELGDCHGKSTGFFEDVSALCAAWQDGGDWAAVFEALPAVAPEIAGLDMSYVATRFANGSKTWFNLPLGCVEAAELRVPYWHRA